MSKMIDDSKNSQAVPPSINPEARPRLTKVNGVPVHSFLTPSLEPEKEAYHQIDLLSRFFDVRKIVLLADFHCKDNEPFPTGFAFASASRLHPVVIREGIGCGMQAIATSLKASDITPQEIDRIFTDLAAEIPDVHRRGEPISRRDLDEIFATGVNWAKRFFDLPKGIHHKMESNGSFAEFAGFSKKQVLGSVPGEVYRGGLKKFGFLGAVGNHFIELQRVDRIYDEEAAGFLGLEKDQIILMLHGDSGAVSPRFGHYYVAECGRLGWRQNLRKAWYHYGLSRWIQAGSTWRAYFRSTDPAGIEAESFDGRRYRAAAMAVENYCLVNRISIGERIKKLFRRHLGTHVIDWELIYDVSHESIKEEFIGGERLWIHRSGASCALPSSSFPKESIYSRIGQPLIMPGAMGVSSYICVTKPGVNESLYSVNHGSGRHMTKSEARSKLDKEEVSSYLSREGIKLFKAGSESVVAQAPQAYKNVESVIEAVSRFDLARSVVRLQPLAVLKG